MKNALKVFFAILIVTDCFLLFSVDFSGNYKMVSGNVQLFLVIEQRGNSISGGLTGTTGADFKLTGKVEGESASGKCYGNNIAVFFNMYFNGSDLYFQLIEPKRDGTPDWSKIRELVFKKTGGSSSGATGGGNPLAGSSGADFSGSFAGDGLQIELRQEGKSVSGILNFKGNRFNISGKVVGEGLNGVFSTGGGSFPFSAKFSGNTLLFETGGTVYRLRRAGVSSNPLAQKKGNPLSKGGTSYNANPSYSGNRIKVDSLGLSFVSPSGWKAQKDPNTGNYFFASDTIPGFILTIPHNYSSFDEIVAAAAQGFVDSNINMHASSDIEKISQNAIGGEFSGTLQNVPAKGYVVGVLSPNGGGFLAMCVTSSDKYSSIHKQSAIALAKSVRFYTVRGDSSLMSWFAGEYYSYTGSTERKLTLCPNGYYAYYTESSYSGNFSDGYGNNTGNWGAAGNNGSRGRWKIVGNKTRGTLIFTTSSGERDERPYQVVGRGVILVDGVKFAYKGRPNCN